MMANLLVQQKYFADVVRPAAYAMLRAERIEMARKAFEADAAPYGFDLTRRECAAPEPWSEYESEATGHRWAGWLAAIGCM